MEVAKQINILDRLVNLVSQHVGDENLKKFYAISLLSIAIKSPDEPLHVHVWGSPESGKTNLQTLFLEVVPNEHKDIASDFSPRCLLYANLNQGSVISINDKILNDNIASLINMIADSTSWRKGRIVAVVLGKDRVNLVFPPRSLLWLNSNRRIIDYNLHEVDVNAVEGRFMVFEKKYEEEQKKNIFIKRNIYIESDSSEIESVRDILKELFKNPKTINCSEDLRNIIWNKSKEMGINSIRQIGRNLTVCQVFALSNSRNDVSQEDINDAFSLLKEQFNLKINTSETSEAKIIELIKKELLPENIFKTLSPDKKILYSCKEIQNKIKEDILSTINYIKSENIIGMEIIKVGVNRTPLECYFLI